MRKIESGDYEFFVNESVQECIAKDDAGVSYVKRVKQVSIDVFRKHAEGEMFVLRYTGGDEGVSSEAMSLEVMAEVMPIIRGIEEMSS